MICQSQSLLESAPVERKKTLIFFIVFYNVACKIIFMSKFFMTLLKFANGVDWQPSMSVCRVRVKIDNLWPNNILPAHTRSVWSLVECWTGQNISIHWQGYTTPLTPKKNLKNGEKRSMRRENNEVNTVWYMGSSK